MSTKRIQIVMVILASVALAIGCGKKADDGKGKGKGTGDGTAVKTPNGDGDGPKPAGGDYEEGDVADGGQITGTVTYTGDKKAENLTVDKDQTVCVHGGEPDGSIEVADGKLKNALIHLVGVKKGKKWEADTVTMDNNECMFSPRVVVGRHKGNVAAKNSDTVLHNTNLFLREGNRALGNINLPTQGQTREVKLKKEGLVDVKCDVHKWMKGFVWVSTHPYAAVTGADGTFTIDGVPPGDYKAKAWHEVFGEKDLNVTVAAGGTATLDVAFE